MRCGACQHDNPVNAVFCASCGAELRISARAPVRPTCPSGRVLAVVGFVGFAALLGFTLIRAGGPSRVKASVSFTLPPQKADALYEMLAPAGVQVSVSRQGNRIMVQGSDREITALERFVTLVTSLDHLRDDDAHAAIHHMRHDWRDEATYDLPWAQREALLRLLSFDNVPVFVKRASKRITIQATHQDRRVIDSIVEILRGNRL